MNDITWIEAVAERGYTYHHTPLIEIKYDEGDMQYIFFVEEDYQFTDKTKSKGVLYYSSSEYPVHPYSFLELKVVDIWDLTDKTPPRDTLEMVKDQLDIMGGVIVHIYRDEQTYELIKRRIDGNFNRCIYPKLRKLKKAQKILHFLHLLEENTPDNEEAKKIFNTLNCRVTDFSTHAKKIKVEVVTHACAICSYITVTVGYKEKETQRKRLVETTNYFDISQRTIGTAKEFQTETSFIAVGCYSKLSIRS